MKSKQNTWEYIWGLIGLVPFLVFTMKDLVTAPLWFDEGIEFFYSKYLFGQIPGISLLDNMYQRIIATYQPPLYNVVLFLWLQISESESWFRFSSVLMGALGAVGLFSLFRRKISARFACLTMIIYSCIHQIIYYSLECSEYIMMLMFLFWMLYFYCECVENADIKYEMGYLIMAVLAIYSHYSAAFVIIPTAISILLVLWKKQQLHLLKVQMFGYVLAVLFAGIPLLIFFLVPQLQNPDSTYSQRIIGSFEGGNIFYDFFSQISKTFRFISLESPNRFAGFIGLALIIFVILAGIYIWKGKRALVKHLLTCSLGAWIIYYGLVRSGIYAYGEFLNRYCLSLLPIWMVTILLLLAESTQLFDGFISNNKYLNTVKKIYVAILLFFALGYCVYGSHQINKHWQKMDCRGVAATWISAEAWNEITFVDFNQNPSFTYYLRQDERYSKEMEENMIRDLSLNYFDLETYHTYFLDFFEGQLPDSLYLCGSKRLKEIMELEGYTVDTLYETTASLYYAYK